MGNGQSAPNYNQTGFMTSKALIKYKADFGSARTFYLCLYRVHMLRIKITYIVNYFNINV